MTEIFFSHHIHCNMLTHEIHNHIRGANRGNEEHEGDSKTRNTVEKENLHMQNNSQRRVTIDRSNIITENGIVTFQNEKSIEIFDSGDVITTETRNYLMLNGEAVADASEIKGQCQIHECSILLTQRTMRFCSICGDVGCLKHSSFDEELELWLCMSCASGLNTRRLIRNTLRLITAPFVERIEE